MPSRIVLAAATAVVVAFLAGCGGSGKSEQARTTHVPTERLSPTPPASGQGPRLFAADSIWNRSLPADEPLDPDSPRLASALQAEVRQEQRKQTGPYIETTEYSTPLYVVGRSQPTTRVQLRTRAAYVRTLQAAFARVPIPDDARPAPGTDGHMTVWQPSTDRLWEFWRAAKEPTGWVASYGGAIRHVSRSPGYFTPRAWPGARAVWGATASSLPVAGGLMTVRELERGEIDHALAIALPAPRKDIYSFPAQRTDGTDSSPDALPEGARLRLDPKLDVDALDVSPVVKAMARAAQRYGMIVRDKTGTAIAFYAEDPHQYGNDPYPRLFDHQVPTAFMGSFPWSSVQVTRLQLHHNP